MAANSSWARALGAQERESWLSDGARWGTQKAWNVLERLGSVNQRVSTVPLDKVAG